MRLFLIFGIICFTPALYTQQSRKPRRAPRMSSEKETPKPTEAVAKSIRFILGFFDNDEFKKYLG